MKFFNSWPSYCWFICCWTIPIYVAVTCINMSLTNFRAHVVTHNPYVHLSIYVSLSNWLALHSPGTNMRSTKKTGIVGMENLQIITREISKYALHHGPLVKTEYMDGGCWCSAGVKGRNYDRVCNSQVALERQGMDEEKATKCDKIAKKTHFKLFNAVHLHSRIWWKIHANYANVYFRVHSTVLLVSSIFKAVLRQK